MTIPPRRTWCIMKWGPVKHRKFDFVASPAFGEKMVSTFRTMRDVGYFPPILREHAAEGLSFGRIIDLRVEPLGLYATAELVPWIAELFDNGHLENWSPGIVFAFKNPHGRGEYLSNFLRELSFVGVPHLKNLPGASGAFATLAELTLADEDNNMDELLEKLLATMEGIAEGISAMSARLDGVLESRIAEEAEEVAEEAEVEEPPAEEPPAEEPPVEMAEEAPAEEPAAPAELEDDEEAVEMADTIDEVAALKAQLAEAQRQHKLLSLKTRLPEASEDVLLALSDVEGEACETLVGALIGAQRVAGTASKGSPVKAKSATPATFIAEARAKGINGDKLLIELADAGYDVSDPGIAIYLGRSAKG